jgi:hypothetical protein
VTDVDMLLAQLRAGSAAELVDRAAEALAAAGESISALADHDDYDTATLWWAAGTLSEADAELLPYTSIDLPDPPTSGDELVDAPEQLINLLGAAADALERAARDVDEPDHIYALAHAGILARQASDAFVNAKVAA